VLGRGFGIFNSRAALFRRSGGYGAYGPLMRFVAGADFAARSVFPAVVRARPRGVGRPTAMRSSDHRELQCLVAGGIIRDLHEN